MRLGIIGLPQSGKTTLFNALTRGTQPTGATGRIEVHTAVVDVPDPRVDRLTDMFKPKKKIYTKVTYSDIAGLDGSASKAGISGTLLNQLSQMDGFIEVVRTESGGVALSDVLPAVAGAPAGDWAPVELVAAVGPTGLVGPPVLTSSSGSQAVDAWLPSYLATTYRLGERLPPGFYRIRLGP